MIRINDILPISSTCHGQGLKTNFSVSDYIRGDTAYLVTLYHPGAAPVRVPWVPGHPLKFSNGCLAPVLKHPCLSKFAFSTRNPKFGIQDSLFCLKS